MNRRNERSIAAFRARLCAWYARNKRAMPWRGTRDAYRVWVSEIMLQQTRVAAVLPYYRRFVRRFPTVRALARARSEEVLKFWAGLGYYSRARNLHRAAKEIVARHGGKFPRDYEAALALPGVGRYTAAAVLSIAYGEPLAVLDGNVARVLARLSAVRGDVKANGRWRKLQEKAQELMGESGPSTSLRTSEWRAALRLRSRQGREEKSIRGRSIRPADSASACGSEVRASRGPLLSELKLRPPNNGQRVARPARKRQATALHKTPGDWNQAMMELGATLCTPRAPRCGECPVARWCKARELGIVEDIPSARRKREPQRVEIAAAVLLDPRGRTLLVKPETSATNGLFSRMWQFPILKPQMHADKRRSKKNEEKRKRGKGVKEEWVELEEVRHTVTFREVRVRPYLVRVSELPKEDGARVVALEKVERMAVSSATKKIAREAEKGLRAKFVE